MTAIACPYCGAALNKPLKFCLSCGRGVSKDDLKRMGGLKSAMKAGVTKRLDEGPSSSNFDLARRDTGAQRNIRQALAAMSYLMVILLVIYFAGSYILQKAKETPVLPPGSPVAEPAPPAVTGAGPAETPKPELDRAHAKDKQSFLRKHRHPTH